MCNRAAVGEVAAGTTFVKTQVTRKELRKDGKKEKVSPKEIKVKGRKAGTIKQ